MGTMMNGYHFDMAKDGANEYLVRVNGKMVIMGANFSSALSVYKYIEESIENAGTYESVQLIKEYDAKTKSYPDEIVRDNAEKVEKQRAMVTRTIPAESTILGNPDKKEYIIGKPEIISTAFGRFVVGDTGAVIQTEKGYFIEKVNGECIFSQDLKDVHRFLPQNETIIDYAEMVGIQKGIVLKVLMQPTLNKELPHYVAGEVLSQIGVIEF